MAEEAFSEEPNREMFPILMCRLAFTFHVGCHLAEGVRTLDIGGTDCLQISRASNAHRVDPLSYPDRKLRMSRHVSSAFRMTSKSIANKASSTD